MMRGGPFDTWGGYGFLRDQTYFLTPNLEQQFFKTSSKQAIFSQVSNTKSFFHHLF